MQLSICTSIFTYFQSFSPISRLSLKDTPHLRQTTDKTHFANFTAAITKVLDDIEISQQEVTFPANILKYFSINLNCMLKDSTLQHVPNTRVIWTSIQYRATINYGVEITLRVKLSMSKKGRH